MKISQLKFSHTVLVIAFFLTIISSQSGLAADFDTTSFFKAGAGYYMPSTENWDDVYDGAIIPFSVGYSRYLLDKWGGNLGFEVLAGYYGKSGDTVEQPGYESETVDFLMIPLTISGILRFEKGTFVPYAGLGLALAYYTEKSNEIDQVGYGGGAILKGGSEFALGDKFRLFAEVSYSYIAATSDDKSLSEGDIDLGGLGAMIGLLINVE